MTNKEKFIEIFGLEPNEHFCPLSEEIGCESCPYNENGCDEDHKDRFFSMEYKEPPTKNDLGIDAVNRRDVHDMLENLPVAVEDKWFNWLQKACMRLAELPSVTPQEPRKGKWIKTPKAVMGEGYMWYCDKCNHEVYQDTSKSYPSENFCPNCGADMREVEA